MLHFNNCGIIPSNVRYDGRLSTSSKLLYAELTSMIDEKGYCNPTNYQLAELYNVSSSTISKWIENLVDCGYINTENLYNKYGKIRLIKLNVL
jgi:hypothetical protein